MMPAATDVRAITWAAARATAAFTVLVLLFSACSSGDDQVSPPLTEPTPTSTGSADTSEPVGEQAQVETTPSTEPPCAPLLPGDDASAVVAAAGPNREICFDVGRYERFSVTPLTGQRFVGVPGTVLDGLGQTAHAFVTTAETKADDVHIEGFEMTGYVSNERCESFRSDCEGAAVRGGVIFAHVALDLDAVPDTVIDEQSSLRWVVTGNNIHDNLGTGISVGDGMRVEGNRISQQSHLGIGGGTVGDLVITGNEITRNSWDERVPPNWESGQIKLGFVDSSTISDNTFTGVGPGIWCDIQCTDITIADNRITDMVGGRAVAIFYEVSENAVIEGNVIDNVEGDCVPADGVGVLLSESRDVIVRNNTITNAQSMVLVQQIDRNRFAGDIDHWAVTVTPDTDSLWTTRNLLITGNLLGPTADGCPEARGGRVGLLVENVGVHPNTENVAPEVTFADNDFGQSEAEVAFLWPTSEEFLTFTEWTELGQS